MKRILLFAFMASTSIYASAQVMAKGDKLLGGDFSISIYDVNPNGSNYNTISNAGISPSFGIAIKDNLVFGPRGNISYNHQRTKYNDSTKSSHSNLGVGLGVFLKKYKEVQNRFGIYFDNELSGTLRFQKSSGLGYPSSEPSTNWGAQYSFNPGVFYRFSDAFLGEANLGGLYASYYKQEGNGSYFGLGASFFQYFNVGISYRFSKKKTEG